MIQLFILVEFGNSPVDDGSGHSKFNDPETRHTGQDRHTLTSLIRLISVSRIVKLIFIVMKKDIPLKRCLYSRRET